VRMIPLDCAAVHDAAPELVLGTLDGVERARVLDHLAGCARCREEVAALADTVSDLALLAPDLSPSAGFTDRILARGPALADGADNDEVPEFDSGAPAQWVSPVGYYPSKSGVIANEVTHA